jgi:hypothetical protein
MQRSSDQTGIRARQVPASIRFLRALDVPAPRLAYIFGESADNIRHIDSRSYRDERIVPQPLALPVNTLALLQLTADERTAQSRRNIQCIRLRSKQDLAQVEATVWAVFQGHKSVGLAEGYEAILAMLPSVANARH